MRINSHATAAEFVDAIHKLTDDDPSATHPDTDDILDELSSLPVDDLAVLARRLEWLQSARPKQLPPEHFFVWLLMAGRGSGKTRAGAEEMWWPASKTEQRIAVIGPTLADVRKTCFEGESGLLNTTPKRIIKGFNRTSCEMWLTNGSYFVGYSSEEPERLRGPQHHRAWCDELAAWRYIEETWDMLMFGLRLGEHPDVIVTTTPKPVGLVRSLLKEPDTKISRESTFANEAHLPETYMAQLRKKYEGTRLGQQELHAEVLDDNPYALWSTLMLDKTRRKRAQKQYQQVLVAVDPPITSGEDADECGIVGGGSYTTSDNVEQVDVLADWSVQGKSPHGWATRAVSLYHHLKADAIVAERNNGGDMVKATIHNVDPNVPVLEVVATRGKVVRAEPVSMLYEQDRAHHVGNFGELESQMCDFTSDFNKEQMGYSPDRVDALVWLITKLVVDKEAPYGMLGAM